MRRTDLDALRILVCLLVMLSHACVPFSREIHYHVTSPVVSPVPAAIYEFIHLTTMPLFFALAGWSALVSLRRRTPGRFIRERLNRVLVPLVAGLVILGPVIKFIELRNGRQLGLGGFRTIPPEAVSFTFVLQHYYTRISWYTWSHLWFLGYLLVISIGLLPLLAALSRRVPRADLPGAAMIYLPILPMAVALVAFAGYWPFLPNLVGDWGNLVYYALCFLLGAGLAVWPGFEQRMRRQAAPLLLLMAVGFAGELYLGEGTAGRLCVAVAAWGAIGGAIGVASRHPPSRTRPFRTLSEATLPVYILHHVPSLMLAWAVVPLDWPVAVKVLAILLPGAGFTFAFYHWAVRPFAFTRWLVGLGPVEEPAPARQMA